MDNRKKLYIHTIGCQMNIYDTEQMEKYLYPLGYDATPFLELADLIIINTCSVREKAEQKTYSYLGRLVRMKKNQPNLIIGVSGCVAQQEGAHILAQVPQIDFVIGTHAICRLPQIIEQIGKKRTPIVDIDIFSTIEENVPSIKVQKQQNVTAFITIIYCTYCVVPFVRGREISRMPERILDEINLRVSSGVREVTLLGQNVNSYGQKQGLCSFRELLSRVNDIEKLFRIRFTTSHPKDLSDDLIRCFGTLKKLCHHIHLPVQSGSNRILKLMNRHYTREEYLEKVDHLRQHYPDIGITSDVIVGFPGESSEDFNQTLDLINHVQYDSLFMFKYSDRPNAPATRFSEKISEPDKKDRFEKLLSLQKKITERKHQEMVGSVVDILTEGKSKRQMEMGKEKIPVIPQWTGRTSTNKIVNFIWNQDGIVDHALEGKMVQVKIAKAFPHSLWGEALLPVKQK